MERFIPGRSGRYIRVPVNVSREKETTLAPEDSPWSLPRTI
jgi:hypothetical protein